MVEWLGDLAELLLGFADRILPVNTKKKKQQRAYYMAVIPIEDLPDSARTWGFGSDRTLDAAQSKTLMGKVDPFLQQWKAHGAELTVGRDWKHGRFLTVAVDQSTAGASGCSIDGLFRTLKALEPMLGASMVTSGLIFYCDETGEVRSVDREEVAALGAQGRISARTRVFDPIVTSVGDGLRRFQLDR